MTEQLKFIHDLQQAQAAAEAAVDNFYKERQCLFMAVLDHWYTHGYHLLEDDSAEVWLLNYNGRSLRPDATEHEMYVWLKASAPSLVEFTVNPYTRAGRDTITVCFGDHREHHAELDSSGTLSFRFDYGLQRSDDWQRFIRRQHLFPRNYMNRTAIGEARSAIRYNERFLATTGRVMENLDEEIGALVKELEAPDGE